jgi:hypothetical protein
MLKKYIFFRLAKMASLKQFTTAATVFVFVTVVLLASKLIFVLFFVTKTSLSLLLNCAQLNKRKLAENKKS